MLLWHQKLRLHAVGLSENEGAGAEMGYTWGPPSGPDLRPAANPNESAERKNSFIGSEIAISNDHASAARHGLR